jgi:HlyD family secretion protein
VTYAVTGAEIVFKRHRGVFGLAFVALLGAGLYAYSWRGPGASRFQTVKVERGPLRATVSSVGTLNAVTTVQVGTQVSGQVNELLADFNTRVTKGQLIARIDPQGFIARVNQANAELEGAEANVVNQHAQVERARSEVVGAQAQVQNQRAQVERALADVDNALAGLAVARAQTAKSRIALLDAKRDLERKMELIRMDLISRVERDSAQAAYDSALAQTEASEAQERGFASTVRSVSAQLESSRAQVEALLSNVRSAEAQRRVSEAQLRAAEANVRQKQGAVQQAAVDLERTAIRSPVDGVVVSRNVDVGQTVAASLSAPTLFTIAQDLTKMQIDTSVDEADIGRIQLSQPVEFTVDSFRGERFRGQVTQIRMAPRLVQNVVTYNVVIGVDNAGRRFLPGLTATVQIIVASRAKVLKVGNAALRFRMYGGDGAPAERELFAEPGPPVDPATAETPRDLSRALALSAAQQRALAPLLEDQRRRLARLQSVPDPERRVAQLRIREETQRKVQTILGPGQWATYERLATPPPPPTPGTQPAIVWTIDPAGSPRAIGVKIGITDGTSTEILDGDLVEGQPVIVAVSSPADGERLAPGATGEALRPAL